MKFAKAINATITYRVKSGCILCGLLISITLVVIGVLTDLDVLIGFGAGIGLFPAISEYAVYKSEGK